MNEVTVVRPIRREADATSSVPSDQRVVIRLRSCAKQTERIGNYLCRLPGGNTGSCALSPRDALCFASIQAAEQGLAEHLAGLPGEKWDAVYEIVSAASTSEQEPT